MLVFQNEGLVPLEAFTTFGMSAKPGSTNPIGKFGTGLKYAVAITLRLGGTFRLYRGLEEFEFYTKETDFRGKTFAKVRMRRRKGILSKWRYEALPFTTELGKHWKPWMAFRELEANVRDENGTSTHIGTEGPLQFLPREDTTLIFVDCPEMDEAYADIDNIFLDTERVPVFENDLVRVFEGDNNHIFYRGMRVTDTRKPTLYTYEMKSVFLTEDRTSQYAFLDDRNIMKALLECPNESMVRRIVRASEDTHEGTFDWDEKKPVVSSAWPNALAYGGLSPRMKSLRDNLDYGLAKDEDVEISLEVRQWEGILPILQAAGTDVYDEIREQLLAAGWKDRRFNPAHVEEIADAVDA